MLMHDACPICEKAHVQMRGIVDASPDKLRNGR